MAANPVPPTRVPKPPGRERRCFPALRASWRIYADAVYADAVERDQGWRTFCSSTARPGCAGPLRRDPAGQRSRSQGRSSHRSTAAATAEQMRALFGAGMHPLAATRLEQLGAADLNDVSVRAATRLGAPFKVYAGDVSPFRVEVAKRLAARQVAVGQLGDEPVSAALRALVRTEVAQEFFRTERGRDPIDAREIATTIAKHSRPRTQTVAGYDLTFSPVKSVSTLWAIADPHIAARIEEAHQAAVQDALNFIERHALFTRQGRNGVRQVNVTGLVAAAFTHRDSRAGDPDLHTHVAVANKVQALDVRGLSIDGRVLFKATVAASETYNTALEHHLRDRLGVRFAERGDTDPRLRPIREIVGVDPALNRRWSVRRASIETRRGGLARQFQRDHGRPPTPVEMLHLAQATLETRDAKHEPRTSPRSGRPGTTRPPRFSADLKPCTPWCMPPCTPPTRPARPSTRLGLLRRLIGCSRR
jgi:conjugative relaxase-like TrwC/TraI family protein